MKSKWILGHPSLVQSKTVNSYCCPFGPVTTLPTTENDTTCLAGVSGTIRKLYVKMPSGPGAGATYTYTVYVNGSPTSLSCTVTNTSPYQASDIVNSASVTAGQTISLACIPSPSPNPANNPGFAFCMEFEGTTDGQTTFGGGTGTNLLGTAACYFPAWGHAAISTATRNNKEIVMPCAGKIKGLYVKLNTAPGDTYSRTFRVIKNGSATGTPSVTISNTDTTGSDTSTELSVVAGDVICGFMALSTGATNSAVKIGVGFEPTTNGNFILAECHNGAQTSTTATRYVPLGTTGFSLTGTEANAHGIAGTTDFAIKAQYVQLDTDPATASSSYVFTLRANTSDASNGMTLSPLSCTIAAGSTANNDTDATGYTPIADYDLICSKIAPVDGGGGAPVAVRAMISYCGYILSGVQSLPVYASDNIDWD